MLLPRGSYWFFLLVYFIVDHTRLTILLHNAIIYRSFYAYNHSLYIMCYIIYERESIQSYKNLNLVQMDSQPIFLLLLCDMKVTNPRWIHNYDLK